MKNKIQKTLELIQEEIDKLRELKEKGKFNLQQSENALKRLGENLLNVVLFPT